MITVNQDEDNYLDMLSRAYDTGWHVPTRNGERRTIIAETLKFSLRNGTLPLMTTRKLPFKSIERELEWFLTGSVDVTDLHAHNCHLWDQWALGQNKVEQELNRVAGHEGDDGWHEAYEEKLGTLVNTIGPMYGAAWRKKFNNGEDQLTRLIRELKANPYSTQHVLTTYAPEFKMDETKSCAQNIIDGRGALTPCHGLHTQFICLPSGFKGGKPRLHCIFTNRSQDLPVGTVFNIAMYALLTHLIAHLCGFEAVELTWIGMHCHIYPDQFGSVTELVSRKPYPFPQVHINPELTDIDQVKLGSQYFTLVNYISHEAMRIPVTG